MSQVEDILYAAWELGIQEKVLEKVKEHQTMCGAQGKWYDQKTAYEEAFELAKNESKILNENSNSNRRTSL